MLSYAEVLDLLRSTSWTDDTDRARQGAAIAELYVVMPKEAFRALMEEHASLLAEKVALDRSKAPPPKK